MGEEEVVMEKEEEIWNQKKQTLIEEVSEKLINGDLDSKIQAARDIRKLVRKSSVKTRSKFAAAGVIQPLVSMLFSPTFEPRQASLLALLNLAVRNEREDKMEINKPSSPLSIPVLECLVIYLWWKIHGRLFSTPFEMSCPPCSLVTSNYDHLHQLQFLCLSTIC
ncbi:hypothetical protein CsSME_00026838 [Camellia sinensis var. sinensis]